MQVKNKILSAEIAVPEKLAVNTDKKTGAKSVYFPFQLPDGSNAALCIIKLVKMGWIPSDEIESITIKFK